MTPPKDRHQDDVAVFRYGLIADLKDLPPGTERAAAIRAKAKRLYTIPGSKRTRVAAQTLRDWLRSYQRNGFEGLKPKAPNRLRTAAAHVARYHRNPAFDQTQRPGTQRPQGHRTGPEHRRHQRRHPAPIIDHPPPVCPRRPHGTAMAFP